MIRVVASVVFLLVVIAYAAPSVIVVWRARRRWPLLVAINLLLGWTIVGWLVALAMALELRLPKPRRRPKARPKRGPTAEGPKMSDALPRDPVPIREHVEPPPVQEEAYTRWLDGGAAMGA